MGFRVQALEFRPYLHIGLCSAYIGGVGIRVQGLRF